MISLKRKESGFTIVELLIVIIVIGILAALVITTFSGVQKKARNTERETDIKAIHGQVEAYYAEKGYYPSLANLQDNSWIKANLKGLDEGATHDPKGGTGNNVQSNDPVGANTYNYAVTPSGCDNGTGGECTGYTLTATLETSPASTFVKTALN